MVNTGDIMNLSHFASSEWISQWWNRCSLGTPLLQVK